MKKYSSLLLLTLAMQSQVQAEGWWQDIKTKVKNTFDKDKSKTSTANNTNEKSTAELIYELQQENFKLEGKVIGLKEKQLRKAYELQQIQKELDSLQATINKNRKKIEQLQHPTAPQQLHTTPAAPVTNSTPKSEPKYDPNPQPKEHIGSTYKDKDGRVRSYPVKIAPKQSSHAPRSLGHTPSLKKHD